ncbi:MAG TPA: hypothetical protein ENJ97_07835, partial [Planctomycetes bacterium]|nr:hypothetical protein [Planctomycetota bacterium]
MKAFLPWIFLLAASCRGLSGREALPPSPPGPAPLPAPSAPPASRPAPSAAPRKGPFFLAIQGDPDPLPCRVKGWKKESLVVEMERKLFSLVTRGESPGEAFPDVLLPRGGRVVWRCRVLEDSGGILTLAIPQAQVLGVTRKKTSPPPPR